MMATLEVAFGEREGVATRPWPVREGSGVYDTVNSLTYLANFATIFKSQK